MFTGVFLSHPVAIASNEVFRDLLIRLDRIISRGISLPGHDVSDVFAITHMVHYAIDSVFSPCVNDTFLGLNYCLLHVAANVLH